MGKKRIATQRGGAGSDELKRRSLSRLPKRKVSHGKLYVLATYNNTHLSLTDPEGGVLAWVSSGGLGFKGARKGTPFAASRAADLLAEKAVALGMRSVDIVVKGVGSGRESSIRKFASRGFDVRSVTDATPIPHNGPRPPKARRV